MCYAPFKTHSIKFLSLIAITCSVFLNGCGGGFTSETTGDKSSTSVGSASTDSGSSGGTSTYSVGGTVSGLAVGKSLVLTNNGTNNLTVSANGTFAFSTRLARGSNYAAAVSTPPDGQTCIVANASGTVGTANVTNISVTCTTTVIAPTAKLLFKSNFGKGVSLGPIHGYFTNGHGAWQGIVGKDEETGYSWPIKALGATFSGIQLITIDTITADTIGNYITNTIEPVVGPKGTLVNELFQNVKLKGPIGEAGSQAPFILIRPTNIGDVTDLYISYWYKHPADLASKLDPLVSSGNWKVQFEFKTGGYEGGWRGDYRIVTNVMKGKDGKLYWMSKGDNVANGPWDRVDYWVVRNTDVPVPVGKWFKFEVFWHRSTGDDGRYWAAVDGKVIVDYIGKNTMGHLGLPINRIMFNNAYSGGHPAVQAHTTGLEIWDGFPCGVGKSCYTPPM